MHIYLLKELYQLKTQQLQVQIITINEVFFKNCAPFTDCISEINNTQIGNAKDIDVVMLMYNLIEYSYNYSKTSRSPWQYCRDEPVINDANGNISHFPCNSALFKFKQKRNKKTSKTKNNGTKKC